MWLCIYLAECFFFVVLRGSSGVLGKCYGVAMSFRVFKLVARVLPGCCYAVDKVFRVPMHLAY